MTVEHSGSGPGRSGRPAGIVEGSDSFRNAPGRAADGDGLMGCIRTAEGRMKARFLKAEADSETWLYFHSCSEGIYDYLLRPVSLHSSAISHQLHPFTRSSLLAGGTCTAKMAAVPRRMMCR